MRQQDGNDGSLAVPGWVAQQIRQAPGPFPGPGGALGGEGSEIFDLDHSIAVQSGAR